jgi:hypothetical protein
MTQRNWLFWKSNGEQSVLRTQISVSLIESYAHWETSPWYKERHVTVSEASGNFVNTKQKSIKSSLKVNLAGQVFQQNTITIRKAVS